MDQSKYKYFYETHMHTCQGSKCGRDTGADMARAFKAAGYDGIIVTDHHFGGNCRPERDLPWEEWCTEFFSGYRDAKAEGDKIGLKVFCGWEAGFNATEFLVYGLDEEWMKQHPELRTCSIKEHYDIVHAAGGMVIQAHPFRRRAYINKTRLFPNCCDGVEGVNASHTNRAQGHAPEYKDEEANPRAMDYAKWYDLPMTAGTDRHSVNIDRLSGMAFERPLENIQDFIDAVLSRGKTNDYLLTDGYDFFGK